MRHAETAVPAVFHGAESDIGLSERGLRKAKALVEFFATQKLDAIISSGMRRAIDTATPLVQAFGMTLQIEPQLHERRVGILGGKAHTPEHPLWTATIARWTAGDTAFTSEGAESLDEMRERILPAWQRITEEHSGKSIVVVAHGMVCKVLQLSILPDWHISRWSQLGSVPNLAISELVRGANGWRALSLNVVPDVVLQTD